MFSKYTKILSIIFGICTTGTIISAVYDDALNSSLDREETCCRHREDMDPDYKAKYKSRVYRESHRLGKITEEDIRLVERNDVDKD